MDLFTLFGTIAINADAAHKTIDSTTGKASGLASTFDKVGTSAASLGKTIAKWLAVGAGGAFLKSSIGAYADYEQLVGGVETLFQNSSSEVMKYASNAFQTAGMSANKYMETVTSFSATLVKGLGGDTAKAAEVADMAVTDMADNANKMGTPIESIQNAYQGFAKQNYTMLDNLKLGYGGTASEMARLINDSGVMGKRFKATAKNLKNIPFDKQIEAIHEMQKQMGIAGTTAEEASGTIAGSWLALGASWENLLAGLSDGNADIDALMDNLFTSVENVAKNIGKVVPSLVKNLGGMVTNVVQYAGQAIKNGWENTIYPFIKDQFKIQFGIDLPDWEAIKATITTKWAEVKAAFDEGGLAKAFSVLLPDWNTLTTSISDGWNNILWPVVQGIFKTAFHVELPSWATIATDISNGWNTVVWPGIQGFFSKTFDVELPEWATVAESIANGWDNIVLPGIQSLFNLIFNVELPDWETLKTDAVTKLTDLSTTISGIFQTACDAISAAIQTVVDLWNNLMESLGIGTETGVNTSPNGVNHGGGGNKNLDGEVVVHASEDSESNVQSMVDTWLLEADAMVEANPGSGNKIQSYLNSLDLRATVKLEVDDSALSGYHGSHASGLDRVPFDGYRALLHKDEMVLTASQAAAYRRGQSTFDSTASRTRKASASTDQPITVNLTVNGVSSNPYEIAGEVRNALELLRWQA